MNAPRSSTEAHARRGFLSLELVLSLPILLVVILASIEFSILSFARGDVVAACRAGSRLASQPGVDSQSVADRVHDVLDPRYRDAARVYVETAEHPGDVVTVAVRVPMRTATPDLLWPIGLGLGQREIRAEIRVLRE